MIIRSLAAVAVILLVLVAGVAVLYAVRELSVPPAPSAQPSPKSATVVDCGTEQYAFGGGYDRQLRDCLAAAFAAGTPATFTSIHRATEGASLTYMAVVHGPVQVRRDVRERGGRRERRHVRLHMRGAGAQTDHRSTESAELRWYEVLRPWPRGSFLGVQTIHMKTYSLSRTRERLE